MSYPGYPPQNPNYPPNPNLPYPTDPRGANNQTIGFYPPPSNFLPYPSSQTGFAPNLNNPMYPPVGPYPAYPNPSYPAPPNPSYNAPQMPYPTAAPPFQETAVESQQYSQTMSQPQGVCPYPGQTLPTPSVPPYSNQSSPYPNPGVPYPTPGAMSSSLYPNPGALEEPLPTAKLYPTVGSASNPGASNPVQAPRNLSTTGVAQTREKMTPTITPVVPFNANQDAEALRKAMKGFGTDEKAIINILAHRTNQQRQEIALQFQTLFGKELLKDLKSEISGKFEDLVTATITPLPEFFARELFQAMNGLGTDEDTLIEVLCTLNNSWIHIIKQFYAKIYNKKLENDIKGDTSGYFQRLLVSLCMGRRDENPEVDVNAAKRDAHSLLEAGQMQLGTDEAVFNSILVSRSLPQLRQIFMEYELMTSHTFEMAIKREFSGSIEDGLLAIVKSVRNCPEFFAERLYKAMSGAGTKDKALIRIIVTRAEFDMGDIKQAFFAKYNKTLASFIEGDTSGDYKKMLLAMIGGN